MIERPQGLPEEAWQVWLSFYGERPLEAPYAAVYPRVSSAGQEEGWSLISQLKAELGRAAEDGFTVLPEHIYWEVHTGEELWERPSLTRLRTAIKAHPFDVVYFYGVDRFARKAFYVDLVVDEATRAGVESRFILQSFEDTPEGHLMRSVAGYVAEKELYAIKERTNRGKRERVVENGKPYGAGKPPFGYLWASPISDSRREQKVACAEDPQAATVVRRIFGEVAAGRGLRAICADLMRDGITTPGGKRLWATGTLSSILRNPAYAGLNFANRWQVIKKNGKRCTLPRPREQWVLLKEGTYPSLVSVEQWDAAQVVKAANKVLAARNNRKPEGFLLRGGFLVCGVCGGAMSSRRYKSGYTVYICHGGAEMHGKRMPADLREGVTLPSANSQEMDGAVWEHVKRLLNEQGFLDAELRRLADADQVGLDVKAIDARIVQIDAEIGNYTLGMRNASALTIPLLTDQINMRIEQRTALETERDHVERRGAAVMRARDHVEQLKLRLGPQLAQALENMPYAERRRTLLALGIRVTVSARPEKGKWGLPPFTVEASLPIERVDTGNSELWLVSQSTQGKHVRLVWSFDRRRSV